MDPLVNELSLFKGKRVFITGHTGFKGSWLTLWLHRLGAQVGGYALAPERRDDLFNILGLSNLIDHRCGDIRNHDELRRNIEDFAPEFLFHLAAQALVRRSYDDPKGTFDTNVGGSINVLEAVRSTPGIRSVVYVTSDKCYRNKEWIWGYRENDELGGHDPYSASKAAAELAFASYVDSCFPQRSSLGMASVRAGNVIGGGDLSADRVVPDTVSALRRGVPVVLRNPQATRPWQHVLEPLSGYLLLASRLYNNPATYTGSWNFGPDGDAIHTVGELADAFVSSWGGGRIEVAVQTGAPHEARLLHLSCDKARHALGWRPRWNFARTVEETARWYKEVDAGRRAVDVTGAQIDAYSQTEVQTT